MRAGIQKRMPPRKKFDLTNRSFRNVSSAWKKSWNAFWKNENESTENAIRPDGQTKRKI